MKLTYALTYGTHGKFRNSRIFYGLSLFFYVVYFIPTFYFWRLVYPLIFSGNKEDSDFPSGLALVLVGFAGAGAG